MKQRGFTLIELLVVIAIIGLLATLAVVSFSGTITKARDTERKSDLRAMQKAIELYYDDHGAYPLTSGAWLGVMPSYGSYGVTGTNAYIPDLAPTYIPILPTDPKPGDHPDLFSGCSINQSGYLYRSDGTNYKLISHCAIETNPASPSDQFYDPMRTTWGFMVCSQGSAACTTW